MIKCRGFTLIEIMVALAILAISMVAIYKSVAGYVNNAGYLEQRTLAQWAAANLSEQVKLENPWPNVGKSDGDLEGFANYDWFWQLEVKKGPEKWLRIAEVQVFLHEDDEAPISQLTFYVTQPL